MTFYIDLHLKFDIKNAYQYGYTKKNLYLLLDVLYIKIKDYITEFEGL